MGGTGQGPQHPFCVLHAVGLAEHFPVHVHHRVTADDHGVRVVLCHRQALAPGQLFHQMGRGVGGHGALVKVADADREVGRIQGKQFPAARAAGG